MVVALQCIRNAEERMRINVEWDGLPARKDWTWEPIEQVREDLPGMLEDYLAAEGHRVLKTQARSQLFVLHLHW